MSPTSLSDLPSDQPAPLGLTQMKRGGKEGSIRWNNTVPAQPLQDGNGLPMRIAITPTRRGWWAVHAQSMWIMVEALWMTWEWSIDLSQNDLDGRYRAKTSASRHNACGWNSYGIDALYRLEANVAYTATMMWLVSTGYNQEYHTNPFYFWIEGEFIGEGGA